MKLQFVAVSETGASELLPLHPETLRVFLILKETRGDRKSKPSDSNPSSDAAAGGPPLSRARPPGVARQAPAGA